MIAELTGMDVANASIYDGASSLAEAALMAHAVTERSEIVLSRGVHPLYKRVTATYCEGPGVRLRDVGAPDGVTHLPAAKKLAGAKPAPRGRHSGRGRPPGLRAHAPGPRAAHPPGQGDLEHLHQRGALRAGGDDLPGHARPPRARAGRRAVDGEGPLRGRAPRQGAGRVASLRCALPQGVHAQAAEAAGARR